MSLKSTMANIIHKKAQPVSPPPGIGASTTDNRHPSNDNKDNSFKPSQTHNRLIIADEERDSSLNKADKPGQARAVNIKELVKHDIELCRRQLQSYSEIFQCINSGELNPDSLIDSLFSLVKALGFDAVSMIFIDSEKPGKLTPPVSRGFSDFPALEAAEILENAVSQKLMEINWNILMEIASDQNSALGRWVKKSEISMTGFVPICEGSRIFGFLFVVKRDDEDPSPLASPILELCGTSLGMALSLDAIRLDLQSKIKSSSDFVQSQFTEFIGYVENLKAPDGALSESDAGELSAKCHALMENTMNAIGCINDSAVQAYVKIMSTAETQD